MSHRTPALNFSRLGIAILVAIATYAVGDAILSPAPISESPSFGETVLASHAVVAAVRIAVIFAAAFVVVSGHCPDREAPVADEDRPRPYSGGRFRSGSRKRTIEVVA
jgi:hypothetical protein